MKYRTICKEYFGAFEYLGFGLPELEKFHVIDCVIEQMKIERQPS